MHQFRRSSACGGGARAYLCLSARVGFRSFARELIDTRVGTNHLQRLYGRCVWPHTTSHVGGGAFAHLLTRLSVVFRCGSRSYQRVLVVKRMSPRQVEENGFSQRPGPRKRALASAVPTTDILVIHSSFTTLGTQSA